MYLILITSSYRHVNAVKKKVVIVEVVYKLNGNFQTLLLHITINCERRTDILNNTGIQMKCKNMLLP